MGTRIGLKQAVQRSIDVVFSAVLKQAGDDFSKLGFPVIVFQFAAGVGETDSQALELGCIARKTVTRAEAGSLHGVSRKFKE
jgi:hypothetical protein